MDNDYRDVARIDRREQADELNYLKTVEAKPVLRGLQQADMSSLTGYTGSRENAQGNEA